MSHIWVLSEEIEQPPLHIAVPTSDESQVPLEHAKRLAINLTPVGAVVVVTAKSDEILKLMVVAVSADVMHFYRDRSTRRDSALVTSLHQDFAASLRGHMGAS